MSILLDYNQLFLSNIFAQDVYNIDENLVRHTVLSCTLSYKRKYGHEYGNIIFCADGKGECWRKKIFPYYKAKRKKNREQSGLNWSLIFSALNNVREEIKTYMPYKMIEIETAEADDVIAILTKHLKDEPILILSGDLDYVPLQINKNVKQYSPIQKKYVCHDNPIQYLKQKILSGDPGDGVPNFLSDDDSFVNPDKRQKPLRKTIIAEYIDRPLNFFTPSLRLNYNRNKTLIDLDNVPKEIEIKVLEEYIKKNIPTRKNMMQYFMNNGLRILTESLNDF